MRNWARDLISRKDCEKSCKFVWITQFTINVIMASVYCKHSAMHFLPFFPLQLIAWSIRFLPVLVLTNIKIIWQKKISFYFLHVSNKLFWMWLQFIVHLNNVNRRWLKTAFATHCFLLPWWFLPWFSFFCNNRSSVKTNVSLVEINVWTFFYNKNKLVICLILTSKSSK